MTFRLRTCLHLISGALVALTLAVAIPHAGSAQPQPAVLERMTYMDEIGPCLEAASSEAMAQTCIGQGSRICMEADPAQNQTTLGMAFCLSAEKEAWGRILNVEYGQAMDKLRTIDAQEREIFPEFANRADSLRTAQRAWITLRDADCTLEYAMWGSGSMRQIAGAQCGMNRTAERAIYLKFLGEYMR